MKSDQPIIANDHVKCYSNYFVIPLYYFPFGKKKVKYSDVLSCELHETKDTHIFEQKLWGMSLSPIWWHCDMNRYSRKYYIVINGNQWPLIGLTMDDRDIINVFNFIQQKMYENQRKIHSSTTYTDEKSDTNVGKGFKHQQTPQLSEKN